MFDSVEVAAIHQPIAYWTAVINAVRGEKLFNIQTPEIHPLSLHGKQVITHGVQILR